MIQHVEVDSKGIWSLVLPRRTSALVRPGSPIQITSVALPLEIYAPDDGKGGLVKTTLRILKYPVGSIEKPVSVARIATLIPFKQEHHELNICIVPGWDYILEASGNPVHLSGNFLIDSKQPTQHRHLRNGPPRLDRSTPISVSSRADSFIAPPAKHQKATIPKQALRPVIVKQESPAVAVKKEKTVATVQNEKLAQTATAKKDKGKQKEKA